MTSKKRARHKAGRNARREEAWVAYRQRRRRKMGVIGVILISVLALSGILVTCSVGGSSKSSTGTAPATTTAGATAGAPAACAKGSPGAQVHLSSPPPSPLAANTPATATFTTTAGTVTVALDTAKTPKTAGNFAALAGKHYYDCTKLFRVAQSIDIVQGGSPKTQDNADPGPGYTIPDEPAFTTDTQGQLHGPYTYQAGDLVMARTAQANSAGAQFFFVTGPNGAQLNSQGTYVVFGHVTSGLDRLQKVVATAKTDPSSSTGDQAPSPPVWVTSVKVGQG